MPIILVIIPTEKDDNDDKAHNLPHQLPLELPNEVNEATAFRSHNQQEVIVPAVERKYDANDDDCGCDYGLC